MRLLKTKLFISALVILLLTGVSSCKKVQTIPIGLITGPSNVCFGEKGVKYFVKKDPASDYILWKVPLQAVIVSGQGKDTIVVNFGRETGSICASFFSKGVEISASSCLDVKFDVSNHWCREIDFKGTPRFGAVGFSIGGKGYVGTGVDFSATVHNDFWEFDPDINTWTIKRPFPGPARIDAVGFSIGNKGYIGTGQNNLAGILYKDFYAYDAAADLWTQIADCGTTPRKNAFCFVIGNKGYVGAGSGGNIVGSLTDFYEYDPDINVWTLKDSNIVARAGAAGFSIGNKGYAGIGILGGILSNDFTEYDPILNTWTIKAHFPGISRMDGVGFSIGNYGYIGLGLDSDNKNYNDFYEFDPTDASDGLDANNNPLGKWIPIDTVGDRCQGAFGFPIGNKGYIGTGVKSTLPNFLSNFWVYGK